MSNAIRTVTLASGTILNVTDEVTVGKVVFDIVTPKPAVEILDVSVTSRPANKYNKPARLECPAEAFSLKPPKR